MLGTPMRRRVSKRRSKERARLPPAESPARMMEEAGMAGWGEPGGGESRER